MWRPLLKAGPPIRAEAVHVVRLGEGVLALGLGEIQARYPDLDIGSYPFYRASGNGVAIVAKGTNPARLHAAIEQVAHLMSLPRRHPHPRRTPARHRLSHTRLHAATPKMLVRQVNAEAPGRTPCPDSRRIGVSASNGLPFDFFAGPAGGRLHTGHERISRRDRRNIEFLSSHGKHVAALRSLQGAHRLLRV